MTKLGTQLGGGTRAKLVGSEATMELVARVGLNCEGRARARAARGRARAGESGDEVGSRWQLKR